MNILDLSKVLAGSIEDQIAWLQARGLLSQQQNCSCGTAMNLQKRGDIQDKYRSVILEQHKCIKMHKNAPTIKTLGGGAPIAHAVSQ